MRIDRTHKPWAIATLAALLLSVIFYAFYASWDGRMRGGSVPGLILGISGYGLMIYSALLGLRKRFPVRRLGRASTWMRGHLWLGLLCFPLLLLHSGFAVSGPLTVCLMILLTGTIIIGAAGAVIQHYLPKVMTKAIPLETIYEEIPRVSRELQREAEEVASAWFSGADDGRSFQWGPSLKAAEVVEDRQALEPVRQAYEETIRPFLSDPDRVSNACSRHNEAAALFASLRRDAPEPVHKPLAELENICEEQRQLKRQKLMYRILHGWLLLHVPLSLALIVLGAIHAVAALWY